MSLFDGVCRVLFRWPVACFHSHCALPIQFFGGAVLHSIDTAANKYNVRSRDKRHFDMTDCTQMNPNERNKIHKTRTRLWTSWRHTRTHTQHIQKSFTMNAAKSVIQITQIGIEQIFSHWFIPYHIRAHKITDYEKKKSIPKGERKHIVNRFVQRYHEYVVELVLSWKFQWLTPFKLTENCCVIEKRIKIKLKEK